MLRVDEGHVPNHCASFKPIIFTQPRYRYSYDVSGVRISFFLFSLRSFNQLSLYFLTFFVSIRRVLWSNDYFKKSENSYQRFKFPKKKIRTKEFLSQGINYIYPVEISMPFLLLWYIRRISFFPLFFFNLLSPDSNYFPISFVFLRRVLRCNDYFSV